MHNCWLLLLRNSLRSTAEYAVQRAFWSEGDGRPRHFALVRCLERCVDVGERIGVAQDAAPGVSVPRPVHQVKGLLEVLGLVCITLGLFTRAVALLLVLEFIVIIKTHLTMQGWGGPGGAEYPFLWFVVYIFIMMRGGGKYSVDAMLGKEI